MARRDAASGRRGDAAKKKEAVVIPLSGFFSAFPRPLISLLA
jgi:hypothetical protein